MSGPFITIQCKRRIYTSTPTPYRRKDKQFWIWHSNTQWSKETWFHSKRINHLLIDYWSLMKEVSCKTAEIHQMPEYLPSIDQKGENLVYSKSVRWCISRGHSLMWITRTYKLEQYSQATCNLQIFSKLSWHNIIQIESK